LSGVALGGDLNVIRSKLNGIFLSYHLNGPSRQAIASVAQGDTVVHLYPHQLYELQLAIPTLPEQQRIADCLTSLDELLAAQARKVEALKAHKKGLMQQLFPQESETQPRLRFPEFRDAREWAQQTLGVLSEVVRGGSPRPIEGYMTTSANGLNWLKIGDVDKEAKFVTQTAEKVRQEALNKTRVVNPGDLILSNSMSFGRPYILQIKTCIHDGWIAITKLSDKSDRDFLYYLISAPGSQAYFVDNAAGSGVLNLNADIIKALPVCFPSIPEQRRIADCLSSLDDLIAAESTKLSDLKTHKKGLMQQLFPTPAED
jgi:type I restriction enzyme S subunit